MAEEENGNEEFDQKLKVLNEAYEDKDWYKTAEIATVLISHSIWPTFQNEIRVEILFKRGQAQLNLDNFSEALEDFQRVLELDENQIANAFAGVASYYLGKYQDSVRYFNKGISIQPSPSDIVLNMRITLSDFLHLLGRTEEALDSANLTIVEFPREPRAYKFRGLILNDLGRLEEARSDFSASLRLKRNKTGPTSQREYLENCLTTERGLNYWLRKNIEICNIFDLNYQEFNCHERVLFAYATLENSLRMILYYHLHYKLYCETDQTKKLLLEHRLDIRSFPKTLKKILNGNDEDEFSILGELEKLWQPLTIKNLDRVQTETQSELPNYTLNDALETRHAIAHGLNLSNLGQRDSWKTISGISENDCYLALSIYLEFFTNLQKIFDQRMKVKRGSGSRFRLFNPNQRGLAKNKTLNNRQTELILKNIK